MYPPDLEDEVCGVAGGACLGLGGPGINVCYQSKSDRLSPLDRQITTGKPSLTAEFNPINPLEQGLGDRFFCLLKIFWSCTASYSYITLNMQ
jgi:hypothetical protein